MRCPDESDETGVLGLVSFSFFTAYCLLPAAYSQEFDRIVIDANFPGAYQVEVADVNGDKKPDIVAVGGSTCAWYENPTWKKRIVTGSKRDARNHLERDRRHRRRRPGRDRHRVRIRHELADEGQARAGDAGAGAE